MKKITYLETGFHVNVPFKKKKKNGSSQRNVVRQCYLIMTYLYVCFIFVTSTESFILLAMPSKQ